MGELPVEKERVLPHTFIGECRTFQQAANVLHGPANRRRGKALITGRIPWEGARSQGSWPIRNFV